MEMVEGVGVHGFHQLGELDRRPASLSTPSILSKWLSENGSKLATYPFVCFGLFCFFLFTIFDFDEILQYYSRTLSN